jgi:hypothetical protein
MALKTKIAKLEDVAEPLRELYEPKDGAFVLKVEGDAGDIFPGLTIKQQELLNEKKTLADKLKVLEGQLSGIDLEKAKKALEAADQAETEKLKLKGDWDTREKQLRDQLAVDLQKREEQFQGELAKVQERNKALESSLYEQLITAQLSAEIAKHTTSVGPLLLGMASHLKVFEEEGKFVAKVVDAQGNPRIADLKGSPFTIAGLVEEFKTKPEWQPLFPASKNGGTGAPGNSTAGPGGVRTIRQGDYESISANLEGIAKGEITVTQ